MTAFGRRISRDLPSKVAADISGKVSMVTPREFSQVPRTNPQLLVIRPVEARTTCKPCYSVVTFRVNVFDANWSRSAPIWQAETKLVVSRTESVQALWSTISDALRTDDLLPAAASGKPAAR